MLLAIIWSFSLGGVNIVPNCIYMYKSSMSLPDRLIATFKKRQKMNLKFGTDWGYSNDLGATKGFKKSKILTGLKAKSKLDNSIPWFSGSEALR